MLCQANRNITKDLFTQEPHALGRSGIYRTRPEDAIFPLVKVFYASLGRYPINRT